MLTLHKKLIVDDRGNPTDVIIPWAEFLEISEMLAIDLDETAIGDLKQAKADRIAGNKEAYVSLDDV
ncbi:MAG: hypothetical protein DM484_20675 [Candidatus Methylumidiphilus alinenensis]|uniref:Uncharacterized protein n=1 Tax=Candidatus Methylumidiphilus alinenensis TaxID=2202197 RepID=A0A2W4SP96_9GAMM|nr:MAG: hypothetical protein DM484_20675 [Candidatus Methylumidiphilus alinenensis]